MQLIKNYNTHTHPLLVGDPHCLLGGLPERAAGRSVPAWVVQRCHPQEGKGRGGEGAALAGQANPEKRSFFYARRRQQQKDPNPFVFHARVKQTPEGARRNGVYSLPVRFRKEQEEAHGRLLLLERAKAGTQVRS